MKIKGAFPVRWAAQNGSDGKGVTIVKTEIKYAADTSGTTKPSSGWQATIPSVSEGNYLWTWTHVEYSDGTKTDAYSVSRHGIDGKGIKSSVTKYCQKANTNIAPQDFPENEWGDFPTSLTNDYWLYTRTIVTYSDNDTAKSYGVSQIGQGSYYAGCNEYYAVSNSKTEAPSGYPDTKDFVNGVATYANGEVVTIGQAWSTNRPDANANNPYIWNFEISYDSRGNKYVTRPICIGNFAKGIVSIVETYAISAHGSIQDGRDYPEDIVEKDWKDEAHAVAPTDAKRYQWNKTTTTYNDGSVQNNYHISAVKGIDGETTFYYAIPSADKITRKHDGTLSPATINCKAYNKTGTDDPKLVTSGAQMSYDYYVGTAKYTVDNYTGGNITPTPWWTKIVFYLKSSNGVVLTQREILVENEDISPEQNLLNDTNFTNLLLDSSTNRYKSEILEGEGVDGSNALLCNPDSLEKDAEPYNGVWTQAVSQPNDKRLLPSTWYALSFWAKTLGYSQIDIKQSSNLYGFAQRRVYLVVATHTLRIRGNVSTPALSAGRDLRVFIYKEDWSWNRWVSIKQSSITEAEVSFTPPSEGTYNIIAFCHADSGGNAEAAQTVYLEWYRLKLANRQNKLVSYCHPNVIDTQQVQVHDGNVINFRPSDGYNLVTLTQSWKRYYMVFKTKSTIPTDVNKVLFRIPKDGNSVYLSQIKLERGVFPTAWTGSNHDTKGYNGAKPDFQKFSQMQGVSKQVYQGVGKEEWYTIVYDDVNHTGWYTPVYSHLTSRDEVLTDAAKWRMSNMQFVATSVFFAQMAYIENLGVRNVLLSDGSTIEGGMCYSDKDENGHSLNLGDVRFWLGSSSPSSGTIRGYKNGKFVAANGKAVFDPSGDVMLCGGKAKFDKDGNTTIANLNAISSKFTGEVNATSGSFTNVEVHGSMRSAFTAPSGIGNVDVNDCISLISNGVGSVVDKYSLPWGAEQSGRRISIVNWKWNGLTSTGFASIKAPTGQYFFEDGIQKSELKLSRQAVELLGYGTSHEFYGWIVMRRENIMTAYQYGKCQRVLFWGSVRCSSSSSYSLSQAWYDGNENRARLSRVKEGLYEISLPSGYISDASKLLVMVTGFGYVVGSEKYPCKATVVNKTSTSFQVAVSDDFTMNDGNFDFFVANLGDWS